MNFWLGFLTGLWFMYAFMSPNILLGHFINLFFHVSCLLFLYNCLRLIKEAVQRFVGHRT